MALGTASRAAAIHRDMRCIAIAICDIYFSHIAIQTYMGYTEIDGRIDGERRKYTKSHSAAATSVGPHTYIFEFRCGAAYTYIYTVNYPPPSK